MILVSQFMVPKVLSDKTYLSLGFRVLTNSKFGLFYSNFLNLTPTFSKVLVEKYGKTPIFSGKQHFYSYFQIPSENSGVAVPFKDRTSSSCGLCYHLKTKTKEK